MTDNQMTTDEVLERIEAMSNGKVDQSRTRPGDRRDGLVYEHSKDIRLAVKVALLTSRPLLLSGPPGCGKSSLAAFVARNLGFEYYEFVATDESSHQDLLWRFDIVRRLNDANRGTLPEDAGPASVLDYIEPGVLWWAFDPGQAMRRGRTPEEFTKSGLPAAAPPTTMPDHRPDQAGAVVLIDEIDKTDSAFCNGLLVPLGSRQFPVPEADLTVSVPDGGPAYSPLVVVTTNNEKELPEAFIRRCIAHSIPAPSAQKLITVAEAHFPVVKTDDALRENVKLLAERFADGGSGRFTASSAEFLDLIGTLITLDVALDSEEWRLIERLVVEKPEARGGALAHLR